MTLKASEHHRINATATPRTRPRPNGGKRGRFPRQPGRLCSCPACGPLNIDDAITVFRNAYLPSLSVALFLPFILCAHAASEEPRDIVRRWIEAGNNVRSIEADFIQERQLKALRQPLSKPGKLWFQKPGSFRWQIGEPPVTIATRKDGGDLTVLETKEKKARVWSAAKLAEETAQKGGQGFAMIGAGFAATLEQFEMVFEIKSAKETKEPGVWEVLLDLKDRKAGLVVKDVVFLIVPADGALRQFELRMRDGSILRTRIGTVKKNVKIPDSIFASDTTGCEIVKES
jgi:outer membrane lipoprotein-sorting protein